jgi:ABC-type transport system involved in cytochrome c biogenesis permease subunit
MPIDSALKAAHIAAVIARSYQGRTQVVTFVSLVSGVWTYTLETVIFRKQEVYDPEQPDTSGTAPTLKADALMIVPISVSMTGVVYVALTSTATALAVSASEQYELIESTPTGILPSGTHWTCDLRRFR